MVKTHLLLPCFTLSYTFLITLTALLISFPLSPRLSSLPPPPLSTSHSLSFSLSLSSPRSSRLPLFVSPQDAAQMAAKEVKAADERAKSLLSQADAAVSRAKTRKAEGARPFSSPHTLCVCVVCNVRNVHIFV